MADQIIVSEGKRFREVIKISNDGDRRTVHQELKDGQWVARFSCKQYDDLSKAFIKSQK